MATIAVQSSLQLYLRRTELPLDVVLHRQSDDPIADRDRNQRRSRKWHRSDEVKHPGYAAGQPATEVEVRFRARGGATVVELEHRGWERLGERAEEARASYSTGWVGVLDRYAQAV